MEIKLPNFLIVGAARSGTTLLFYCLKQHPEVYIPSRKECRFFSQMPSDLKGPRDELFNKSNVKSLDEYKLLFSLASTEKAIGDISPDYLYYYHNSIRNIRQTLGDVKILIILRNPVERTYSQYLFFIRTGKEIFSFEEALRNEDKRKELNWHWMWFYKDVSFYYKQVKAYVENFSKVKVYLYNDLKNDTLGVIKDIYNFLVVDSSFVPDIKIKNVSGVPKNRFFDKFITRPNIFKSLIKPVVKILLPGEKRTKLRDYLMFKNLPKPEMKSETREYLKNLYREDILKLQDLINRDLSQWLR